MEQMNKKNRIEIFLGGRHFVQEKHRGTETLFGGMLFHFLVRMALLAAFLTAALGFSACGKSSGQEINGPSFEASSQSEEPIELTEEEKLLARLVKQRYQDAYRSVEVIGLKTYKKLESERFTDRAPKGKVYLVLFLRMWNEGQEKFYFNPYQISAEVDGEKIEHTVLWNSPEGYPTAFQNVDVGSRVAGFVAWTVPKDWEKLHVEYQGFDPGKEALMKMDLTTEELLTPDEYDPKVYE